MKKIFFVLLLLSATVFGQKSVNNYEYIIVPVRFDFVKKKDQYKTSSLTKFLFNKYGFKAFLSNENLPESLNKNRCKALIGTVKDDSGMFNTKSIIELRDCYNNLIYTSKEGKSSNKDYKKAYHEAIRNAFKSIEQLKYKYTPVSNENEVAVVEESQVVVKTPKVIKVKKNIKSDTKVVTTPILYAQSTNTGYQVIDSKPKVVFKILKTNVKDVYVIQNMNGILYKNGNIWIAEYYKGEENVIEKYQIKF
ncbi:hypothetical protein [uncultured Tenacibaculum sp.]|uniref:hypothetical protein n=1 Tax=uncultured Tenacibaculum sp. TaxID=174713 RepID=UPI00260414B9|nr:hypothetical protein [uncultured Tenacibaculum sp.]